MPGATMSRNCSSHNADRPRTGNEHIFTYQVEGQCGVYSIAKRIKYGSQLIANLIGDLKRVVSGYHQILCKCAGPIYTNAKGVSAQMATPGPAVTAVSAGDMSLHPRLGPPTEKPLHFLPHGHHFRPHTRGQQP